MDGYRSIAMKTQPTREELKKASRHFFRFGLMQDFEEEIKLSKHIQVRRYKNLIECIVDGNKVRETEVFVLAHFMSMRDGRLYSARGRHLELIIDIGPNTTSGMIAGRILREQKHNQVQHFVLRPHHHTRGHPIGGSLAKNAAYKHAVGGSISMTEVGEGMRKVGRTTGRLMTVGGATAMAGVPIVAMINPAAVPAYAAIAGSVAASGYVLNKSLEKNADLSTFV